MKASLQYFAMWIVFLGGGTLLVADSPVWIENNGMLVMEAEDGTPETGDTWSIRSDVDDYVGEGFIRWEGSDYLSNRTHGLMVYRFIITTPGRYRLFLRSFHDPASRGKRPDEENDCWTNIQLNSAIHYYKTFRNAGLAGTDWSYRTQWVLGENNFVDAYYDIPAGQHEFRLAARAAYYMIDRIFLAKDRVTIDEYSPESLRAGSVSFENWIQDNFTPAELNNPALEQELWGYNADPDDDGLANALEFYSGGDPFKNDADSIFQIKADSDGTTLRIRRALTPGGLSLALESSENLINWAPQADGLSESYADGSAWMKATIPDGDLTGYIRLIIE